MKQMPDNCVDLTVTSPPYDNLREYKGFVFDFEGIAQQLYRVTKQGGVVVWVVGDATIKGSETGTSFRQALYFKDIGFNLHDTMIFRKINPMPVKSNRYLPCFEYMFILSKGSPLVFNPLLKRTIANGVKKYSGSDRENGRFGSCGKKRNLYTYYQNIWDFKVGFCQSSKDNEATKHPAIFPENLAKDHIISWSNEGDTVLDPFAGSGTTAKMSILMGRNYTAIEISKEYCEIARKRVQEAKDSMGLFK
jgi:site-specific DNA-methyltransferase (adenine-specific)